MPNPWPKLEDMYELSRAGDSGSLQLVVSTKLLDSYIRLTPRTYTKSDWYELIRFFDTIPVKVAPDLPPGSWFLYTMKPGYPEILHATLGPP